MKQLVFPIVSFCSGDFGFTGGLLEKNTVLGSTHVQVQWNLDRCNHDHSNLFRCIRTTHSLQEPRYSHAFSVPFCAMIEALPSLALSQLKSNLSLLQTILKHKESITEFITKRYYTAFSRYRQTKAIFFLHLLQRILSHTVNTAHRANPRPFPKSVTVSATDERIRLTGRLTREPEAGQDGRRHERRQSWIL